jgi:catalase (peroxidase I)
MGPVRRFLGPWVAEAQLWQDPVPAHEGALVSDADIAGLKATVLSSGLTVAQLALHAQLRDATLERQDESPQPFLNPSFTPRTPHVNGAGLWFSTGHPH